MAVDRDLAVDAAWRWLSYQLTTTDPASLTLDRDLTTKLVDVALEEGSLPDDVEPALLEVVRELQRLRDDHRQRVFALLQHLAELSGVPQPR